VSVSGPSLSAQFSYDGDGRRVMSAINGVTTVFVGGHYEVTGGAVTKYYFAGASRVAIRQNGTLYYLLSDHLGSTSLTTDASGVKVAGLRYNAWGSVRYADGATPTKYTFTGQYSHTADFGLMFFNARWYDGYLNRWTSPDSVVPDYYNPLDLDRYQYVRSNPVKYNDPTGHMQACADGDAGGGCGEGLDTILPLLKSRHEAELEKRREKYASTISGVEDVATMVDFMVFLANAGFTIPAYLVVAACAGACLPEVAIAYSAYSIIPNGISTLSGIQWIVADFLKGSNDIAVYSTTSEFELTINMGQDTALAVSTNALGWTILKEPFTATMVDAGVAGYDLGGQFGVVPTVFSPSFSFNSNNGFQFLWNR
jgi:RHS repeat-associated protein